MRVLAPTLVAAVMALVVAGCRCDPRPNIVLISLDTLRADHLGSYGYSRPTSPFLDELADLGTVFDNALVQAPGTLPSHMSIFTGLYPNEHDVFPPDGALAPEIPTLPEMLRNAGYRTAGFTEGGQVAGGFGFDRGFDRFDDIVPTLSNDMEVVFSRGLEFIRAQPHRRPFFVFLHTHAIGDPYLPPLPYTTLYLEGQDAPKSLESRFPFFHHPRLPLATPKRIEEHRRLFKATEKVVRHGLPPAADLPTGVYLATKNLGEPPRLSPQTLAYFTSLYDAQINYVDDVLRAFFGSLEGLGVLGNTIVIITSDHGEEFLEHGMLAHKQLYQESLRVPLIVVSPGHRPGRRISEIVRSIDLPPTILELAQAPNPAPMSGVSLAPLLAGSSTWQALESFARNHDNTARSLHLFDDRLLQVVDHRPLESEHGHWHSKEARFTTNRTDIEFTAMSYHKPRRIEVLVDGVPHSILTMKPGWQEFSLVIDGGTRTRTYTLRTPGCDIPALLGENEDQRCLSFRIAGFPQDRLELFDLSADPSGTTDISAAEPELASALERRIETYEVAPANADQTADLSPEVIERLKPLGYLQ